MLFFGYIHLFFLWNNDTGRNTEANLDWFYTYKRPANQITRGGSILTTTDGGYLVGSTTVALDDYREIWLLKLDSNGKELWNKTYKYYLTGYDQMVWLTDIIPTSDTEYALIGMTETSTSWNVWLLE